MIDANGNRAELRYDGHGRQDRWTFPSTTRPTGYDDTSQATALATAGSVNPGDYEEYGYDAAGNRTSLRKRDGSTLAYQYDNLNPMIFKAVPERAGLDPIHTRDVHYGHDLRNLQLFARFDSASGEGVTNTYDGFGRQTSSSITRAASRARFPTCTMPPATAFGSPIPTASISPTPMTGWGGRSTCSTRNMWRTRTITRTACPG